MVIYLKYQWLEIEEDTITIGLTEEGLDQFIEIKEVILPEIEEIVERHQVCMELFTDEGSFDIYSPVEGQVSEVNEAVAEEPNLINDDNYGDGWILKIDAQEPIDEEELARMSREDI